MNTRALYLALVAFASIFTTNAFAHTCSSGAHRLKVTNATSGVDTSICGIGAIIADSLLDQCFVPEIPPYLQFGGSVTRACTTEGCTPASRLTGSAAALYHRVRPGFPTVYNAYTATVSVTHTCATATPTPAPTATPAPCPAAGTAFEGVVAATYVGGSHAALMDAMVCSSGTLSDAGIPANCTLKPSRIAGSAGNLIIGAWAYTGEKSETDCGDAGTPTETLPEVHEGEATQCAVSASGRVICIEENPESQCGRYDGERFCAEPIPDGTCITRASGAKQCAENAGTPPAPDSGTPGDKATPDAQIGGKNPGGGGTTNTSNFYSSGTVANSSDGDDDEGPECADGEPCGEPGDCEEGQPCSGSFSGPGGTAKTFTETMTDFRAGVQQSALMVAVNAAGSGMPAGECPAIEFTAPIIGNVYTDIHCQLMMDNAPALSLMMIGIYALFGLRTIVSA